jgi:hypothetical protein
MGLRDIVGYKYEIEGPYLKKAALTLPSICPCCSQEGVSRVSTIGFSKVSRIIWPLCRFALYLRGFLGGAVLGAAQNWQFLCCERAALPLRIFNVLFFIFLICSVVSLFWMAGSEETIDALRFWGCLLMTIGASYLYYMKMPVEFYPGSRFSKQRRLRVMAKSDTWLREFAELNKEIVGFGSIKQI